MNVSTPIVVEKFGTVAVLAHWTVAILVFIAGAAGLVGANTDDADLTRSSLVIHQSFGLIVLALAVARMAWRLTHPAPPLPDTLPRLQWWAAGVTHVSLYLLLLMMPLTGYFGLAARGRAISIFGLFDLPKIALFDFDLARQAQSLHDIMQYALYVVVVIHIGAVFYHQFVMRDGLLRRMWFDRNAEPKA